MKILYYFKYKETPMFQWQKFHIFDELATHGIEIELFNPLEYSSFDESNEKLCKRIRSSNVDLFMTTSTDKDLYIESLQQVKAAGIPTLLICFDNLTVPFAHKKIAPHFDLVWLTSIETRYLFDRWGVNSVFLPYAANPQIYNPQDKEVHSIVFVGTPYGSRAKMLNTLLNGEIRVDLYGGKNNLTTSSHQHITTYIQDFSIKKKLKLMNSSIDLLSYPVGRRLALGSIKNKLLRSSVLNEDSPFLNHYGPLNLHSMIGMYNSYDLSLSSVTNRHTGVLKNPVLIVNLRNFEIATAGGILFSQFNPELNSYFEDGKEAIYYINDEDMVDKAKFYLQDSASNLRRKIKAAARNKAINEHTWFHRFKVIFTNLSLTNYK